MWASFNAYLIAQAEEGDLNLLKGLTDLGAKISTDNESGVVRALLKGEAGSLKDLITAVKGLSSATNYCIVKPYLMIKIRSKDFSKAVKILREFCNASVSMRGGIFRCVKILINLTMFLEGRSSTGVIMVFPLRGIHTHPHESPSKIQLFISCSELSEDRVIKPLNHLLFYLKESLR